MPISPPKKKNTESNCFSITIRPGHGIDLGNNAVEHFTKHFLSDPNVIGVVFNVEKTGIESHIQGGIFLKETRRQDKVRETVARLVSPIMEPPNDDFQTTSSKRAIGKHGIFVVEHNNWHKLVKYCCKELTVCHPMVMDADPTTLLAYKYPGKRLYDILDEIFWESMPKNNSYRK
ncbi:MAG: hypothetical protein [Circular genetic element sp.]|nr:MAG: hypothetical protein [Circular genetic element sp.]